MCYKTDCPKCKKPTWAGCGQHIDSVSAPVSQVAHPLMPVPCRCRAHPVGLHVGGMEALTNSLGVPEGSCWWCFAICVQALADIPMEERCVCKPRTLAEAAQRAEAAK